MKEYNYDLHIHSCLSPCADNEMTPNNIVNMASILGCDILAVSDHNNLKNVSTIINLSNNLGILGVPAVELCTQEEAHILCFFDSIKGALAFDEYLYSTIPPIKNKPDVFGEQLVMNEKDEIVGVEERLLITAADISAYELTGLLNDYGGVAVPAHIDKSSYSLMAALGVIPDDYGFTCVELRKIVDTQTYMQNHIDIANMGILKNSDAHYLENMSDEMSKIKLDKLCLKSFISAIKNGLVT